MTEFALSIGLAAITGMSIAMLAIAIQVLKKSNKAMTESIKQIHQLETALNLAVGELSGHTKTHPSDLRSVIMMEAADLNDKD